MVIPRSRSSSFESITRSITASFSRKMPLCLSMASTSVVLPWSTCAMIAILRMLSFLFFMNHFDRVESRCGARGINAGQDGGYPDQRGRTSQQGDGRVKLDGPAKALLVDDVNQHKRQNKTERQAQQIRREAQKAGFEQDHAAHLCGSCAEVAQQAELAAPVEHHGEQRIRRTQHGHCNGHALERVCDSERAVKHHHGILAE